MIFEKFYILPLEKKKTVLLGLGFFAAIILYLLCIQPCYESFTKYHELKYQEDNQISNSKIAVLKKKKQKLDRFLKTDEQNEDQIRKQLLDFISIQCSQNNSQIINFPIPNVQNDTNYTSIVNTCEIKGSFQNLVKILYAIEHQPALSKIISVKYLLRENKVTKTKELILSLYFQSLLFKKNETT